MEYAKDWGKPMLRPITERLERRRLLAACLYSNTQQLNVGTTPIGMATSAGEPLEYSLELATVSTSTNTLSVLDQMNSGSFLPTVT